MIPCGLRSGHREKELWGSRLAFWAPTKMWPADCVLALPWIKIGPASSRSQPLDVSRPRPGAGRTAGARVASNHTGRDDDRGPADRPRVPRPTTRASRGAAAARFWAGVTLVTQKVFTAGPLQLKLASCFSSSGSAVSLAACVDNASHPAAVLYYGGSCHDACRLLSVSGRAGFWILITPRTVNLPVHQ